MSWYSSVPSLQMLDTWIKNNYNVLFHGRPGVGKTSMVFEAFDKQGWEKNVDYLYFSAATIDPWVDLIGVPSKMLNEDGEEVLKLVRPETIKNKTIKAFFVDELNRSHKKVRNALMELIQFKSINGLRFPNLEIIWAAVNPADDEEMKFDVEKLDLAQEDRFHIHVQIPYKPNEVYFAQKFNDPDMAEAVCKWWNEQPEKVKQQLTPRRLEYAIDVFMKTNDLRFVIPSEAHISSLKSAIQCGNPEKTLLKLIENNDTSEIRKWLAIENNLNSVQNLICTNRSVCSKVLHLLSDERVAAFASKHKLIVDQIKDEPTKYERIIRDFATGSTNKKIKETFAKLLPLLDANKKQLQSLQFPQTKIHGLTPRVVAKATGNYAIQISDNTIHVNNNVAQIVDELTRIANEVLFCDTNKQLEIVLENLAQIVYPSMGEVETNACLKILDYIFSKYNMDHDEHFCDPVFTLYLPLVNTCVMSHAACAKSKNEEIAASLYKQAPHLYMKVLLDVAENNFKWNIHETNVILQKIADNKYEDISNETEKVVAQNLDDLF